MAFTRTDLSGNLGTGSNAPALFTYLGVAADLNSDVILKSFGAKGGDIIMVIDAIATAALTTARVIDTTGTLSTTVL